MPIGKHHDVLAAVALAPGRHDKGIVDGDAYNFIDSLVLEVGGLLDIGGQMARRAGWSECAGHGEQRNALARKKLAAGSRLWSLAGRDCQRNIGEAVPHLDRHVASSFGVTDEPRLRPAV